MIYDLTILSLLPNTYGAVMPLLPELYKTFSSTGKTIGAFSCEFGVLNRFAFLTAYESIDALATERARLMGEADPYGCAQYLGAVDSTACKPFSFSAPIELGSYGPFYEFRTYSLKSLSVPETDAAWAKVAPRRNELSKMLMVMGSIEDGPQKMVHIWPYPTIEARMAARAAASKEGIWPPPGGSVHLTALQSELFVALPFSDLK